MVSMLVMTTVFNLAGIKSTTRAAMFVLVLELFCIASFCIAAIGAPPSSLVDSRPPVTISAILGGAGLLALSFLGFDAVTTLADDAKNPKRDIPRAVVATCLMAGLLFCGVCVVAFRAYPVSQFENPETAGYTIAEAIGGRWLAVVVTIGLLVGGIASMLASHAGAARLLVGMSRQTGLFTALARIHPVRHTPDIAILIVAVIGLLAFGMSLDDAISYVNFGALVSFLVVNVAVIGHFIGNRQERRPVALLRYLVLPLLGVISTGALLWGLSVRAKVIGTLWVLGGLALARRRAMVARNNPTIIDEPLE
jgi:amino acid transporter